MNGPPGSHTPGPGNDPGPGSAGRPGAVRAVQLRECSGGDLDAIGALIADAFDPLPPSRWLIADPAARHAIMPGVFRLYAEDAWAEGTIYVTADWAAVALWLPVGGDGPTAPPGYATRLAAATPGWTDRFAAFGDLLAARHPVGAGHHHLAILAIRPGRQGQGLGSALLRAHHKALDTFGLPAYLESSSPRACDLYRRHGYTGIGMPIQFPDGGPQMWPMWRDPATAARPAAQREGD